MNTIIISLWVTMWQEPTITIFLDPGFSLDHQSAGLRRFSDRAWFGGLYRKEFYISPGNPHSPKDNGLGFSSGEIRLFALTSSPWGKCLTHFLSNLRHDGKAPTTINPTLDYQKDFF